MIMPNALVKKISKQTGQSEEKLEEIWQKAIIEAKKNKIEDEYAYAVGTLEKVKNNITTKDSNRIEDEDFKYLTVENCILTGEDVARYFGYEIPDFKAHGLQPNKIYYVLRPVEEIKDTDFSNKPLLSQHLDFSAEEYKHKFIVGTIGETKMANDELKGTVVFWSAKAIEDLKNGKKSLSCGYIYTPKMQSGVHNGKQYDLIMTDIKANHVAMVDNPRYKPAIVADEAFNINNFLKGIRKMGFLQKLRKLVMDEESMSFDEAIEATKAVMTNDELSEEEKDKALAELKKKGKEVTKDEDLKAKVQKETEVAGDGEDKPDKDKIAKDSDDDDDDDDDKKKIAKDKDCDKVTMDIDIVEKIIQKRVQTELAKHSAKRSTFDSALNEYQRTCGKPNAMAFDSADSIYNAILKNNKRSIENKTFAQKQAMVEMIPSIKTVSKQMTYDHSSTGNKLIPNSITEFMKGKI